VHEWGLDVARAHVQLEGQSWHLSLGGVPSRAHDASVLLLLQVTADSDRLLGTLERQLRHIKGTSRHAQAQPGALCVEIACRTSDVAA
jgi:hypothetical protein